MSSSTSNPNGVGTMDILAAAFFVIAGAWLLVALVYSTLVLIFLRLRARGELGNIYEEDFGRLYLCGTRPSDPNDPEAARGCYIPLGRIFRRYIAHLQYDANGHGGPDGGGGGGVAAAPVRFMTRDERRKAMETLLMQEQTTTTTVSTTTATTTESTKEPLQNSSSSNPKQAIQKAETRDTSTDEGDIEQGLDNNNDHDDDDVALCSICLGEYDDLVNDPPISVPTACRHEFHRDCLLDWLQRANNTECPCCRERLVQEDAVWNVVQQQRKDRRKQLRRLRKQQRAGRNGSSSSHEDAAAPEPTERTERLEDDDDDDDIGQPVLGSSSSSAPAPLQTSGGGGGGDDNDGEEEEDNDTAVVATTTAATNSNSDDVETGLVVSEVQVEV